MDDPTPPPLYSTRSARLRCTLFLCLLLAVVTLLVTSPQWITSETEEMEEDIFAPDVVDAEPDHNTQDLNGDEQGAIEAEDEGTAETGEDLEMKLEKADSLQVAWIMSFGGSGTSYTIMNTERMTGTTTATNYGRDLDPCFPVHMDWTDGPFLHNPTAKNIPPTYILTKTHCGGYCMDCAPSAYVMDAPAFDEQCRTGTRPADDHDPAGVSVLYARSIPQRAVHLIRNPFDNLVSRMHLSNKVKSSRGSAEVTTSNSSTGQRDFADWCQMLQDNHLDRERHSKLINNTFLDKYQDLPCHSEWFKYVQWHNNANDVIHHLDLPHLRLKYESYETDFDETVGDLFEFLELEGVHDPVDFIAGKGYGDYYSEDDKRLAAKLVQEMASPVVWGFLQDYFDGYISEDEEPVETKNETPPVTDDKEADTKPKHTPTIEFEAGDNSEVAWLLSFPNSGTSYTISNTERMTNSTTSSNYADDWEYCIPVRPELAENGPFIHNLKLKVPPVVLTKTHCTGYCDDCSPSVYVNTVDSFQDGCLSGHMNKDGEKVKTMYDPSVPISAVHLVRNPFDNIVSRLHLALDRRERQGWTQEELDSISDLPSWCSYIDGQFDVDNDYSGSLIFDSEIKELFESVPCHDEWYRYVQWHNLAIEVTNRLELDVHYLRYEDYSTDYDTTVQSLFQFLGLDMTGSPLEFESEKTYDDLYDVEDKKLAKRLVRALASDACWGLLAPYFEGIDD